METGVGMIGVEVIDAGTKGAALVNHQLAGVLSATRGVAAAGASSVHQTAPSLGVSAVPDGTAIMARQTGQWIVDPALWVPIARV